MNRRPQGSLPLSLALIGFVQCKEAEGLRPNSIANYRRDLDRLIGYAGDLAVEAVSTSVLRAFFAYLHTEYVPRRRDGRNDTPLSGKTIRNYWVSFSAFFTWAKTEFGIPDPMDGVPVPRFHKAQIQPFTRDQLQALLTACDRSRDARTERRRSFTFERFTGMRDRTIIKTLLDTGLRADELCALDIRDYDAKTGELRVRHGKGGKMRFVFVEKSTRRDLWRYLIRREDRTDSDAPIFIGKFNERLNPNALRRLLSRLGEKAGVPNTHPHRFRHTFAVQFLRGGGDVFSLQNLLGHSTLDMVKNYVALAQIDVQNAHRRASPVDNWRL
jgi:integrase/recombinase XerD